MNNFTECLLKVIAGLIVWTVNIFLLTAIGYILYRSWNSAEIIKFIYVMWPAIVFPIIMIIIKWAYSVWYNEDE